MAQFPCQLRCRSEDFGALDETLLQSQFNILVNDGVHCLDNYLGSGIHELVVDIPRGIGIEYPALFPVDDMARVHAVIDHECGDSGDVVSVNDCPVDWGCAPVLRQKGGV